MNTKHQKILVKVNPKVLKWTIESSGWEIKELSEKTKIDTEKIEKWLRCESQIELNKLEKLAHYLKRPSAVFFLPEPPKEERLTDYRKIPGTKNNKLSKKTLDAIRNARYVQTNARELFELQNIDEHPKIEQYNLNDDPEKVAQNEGHRLNFEIKIKEKGWASEKAAKQAYQQLREKIESLNVFVLQSNMPIIEARGFTLTSRYPIVIVVNSVDSIKPRTFTLLHEYAHILLRKNGMCLPNSESFTKSIDEIQLIEKWCNAFAGSLLMPKEEFLTALEDNEKKFEEPTKMIINLSKKFRVSKKAVTVRILNLITDQSAKKKYLEYYNEIIQKPSTETKSKSPGNQIDKCLGQKGRKYVKLVSDSKNKQLITINSMINYLDLKVKHFEGLEAKI